MEDRTLLQRKMSSQYAPSQPRGVGARSLPPLDMSGLGNNLPPLPPSTSPSYTSATRPRPTFNSTTAAGIKSQQYNSSYNSPSQSTFSPYSPIPPVNIHSSTSSAPHHQLPPAPPPATSLESRGSWQQQQGPSGEQQGFVGAAPSATAMHQRPLPTPPPVLSPTSTTSSGKRPNPLEDLIYTETLYVDDLGVIIKVSAARLQARKVLANVLHPFVARCRSLVALQFPSAGARLDVSRRRGGVPHQQVLASRASSRQLNLKLPPVLTHPFCAL